MAVSFVGVSTPGNTAAGTSNSLVTTLPSGWAAGDLAVLVGHLSGGSLNMSTPAGWTLLPGVSWPVTEGANSRAYGWYRVLQAGDTAPTISINGAMTGGWTMTAYRDASGVAQAATATASGTSVTLPTLTGVAAGSALVEAAHVRVASGTIPTNLSPNVAYTEVIDHATSRSTGSANVRMHAAYRLIGSAGSYGGETVGSDVTGSMVGVLVELTAASVGATVAPSGLPVPAAVGSPAVSAALTSAPAGVSVPATVGAPAVSGALVAGPAGVTVPVAVGSPGASWATSAAPPGLSVPVAPGSPAAGWAGSAAPAGLTVPAAAGSPSVGWSATVAPAGLTVPVAPGSPSLLGVVPSPDGLTVPISVGSPAAGWALPLAPDGVALPVNIGAPAVGWSTTLAPGGLTAAVQTGSPAVGAAAVTPDAVLIPVEVGDPTAAWATAATVDGLAVSVALSSPTTGMPGQIIHRPFTTPAVRPTAVSTPRPVAVAVTRPSL
ncbi:hypothetical protein ACLQ2W_28425 [Micromonospora sp. DT227]